MTIYRASKLFFYWMLLVLFTFPFWMSALHEVAGDLGTVIGITFWLCHGAATMFAFRCPDCGLSPFISNKGFVALITPWPRQVCGLCGKDHTHRSVR